MNSVDIINRLLLTIWFLACELGSVYGLIKFMTHPLRKPDAAAWALGIIIGVPVGSLVFAASGSWFDWLMTGTF